ALLLVGCSDIVALGGCGLGTLRASRPEARQDRASPLEVDLARLEGSARAGTVGPVSGVPSPGHTPRPASGGGLLPVGCGASIVTRSSFQTAASLAVDSTECQVDSPMHTWR